MATTSSSRPTMQTFRVMVEHTGGSIPVPQRVEAAYFQHDDGFIAFKDADNKVVYYVRSGAVVSIERLDAQQDGQKDA